MDALQQSREYLAQYEYRIDQDGFRGDLKSRTRYENVAYHQAMMHAAIAQVEELRRIADLLESLPARASDDPIEEFRAEKKQAQEWAAGVRRGMGLEE